MQKVLITDSLFIFPEHEEKMRAAGLEVERLNKLQATEDELIAALQGKNGYILGGIEEVTDKVIAAANDLRVIAFTGADWAAHIPGHETATKKGIVITNTPGNTTFAVAEFAITLMLMMLRRVMELGGPGKADFITCPSLADVRIGVVGMGRIGERVTRLLLALGAKEVSYYNRTRKPQLESELGITYRDLNELLGTCNVITNHVSTQAGQIFSRDVITHFQPETLFVNAASHLAVDMDALYEAITNRGVRAAFDIGGGVHDERFQKL